MTNQPKPCPFCGSTNIGYCGVPDRNSPGHSAGRMQCSSCGAEGAVAVVHPKDAALAAWNRREGEK